MPRRKPPVIGDSLLDQLLGGADARTAFDADGLLDQLKKALAERALNAEMDHHLVNGEPGNSRNGYAHRDVLVKGYVDTVAISVGAAEIARHPRPYDSADFVFDPLHYLALLEMKVGALDQAAPLQGWALPDAFPTLRRLLEARLSGQNRCAAGKREYVQVLRLLETFPTPSPTSPSCSTKNWRFWRRSSATTTISATVRSSPST